MNTIDDYLSSGAKDIAPLLSLALQKNTAQIYAQPKYQLNTQEKNLLDSLIEKRSSGIPFAYLSGTKGFYHLDFQVTPDVLIPRPETELLIDIALDLFPNKQKPCDVLDLGTGSGVIAITLADKNPNWHVTAIDLSKQALDIARKNATTKIDFIQGSWFEPIVNQSFDLIVSNPPYIKENDPYLEKLKNEPTSALVSGKSGLNDINMIINQAPKYLKTHGYLLMEHGYDQQDQVVDLLKKEFKNILRFKDYNQNNRAVLAQIA